MTEASSPRAFYQVLRLHQLVETCLDETLAGDALTASQYTMLSLVRRLAPATSAQIARWLQVSAQSAGEMLKVLEARGFVQRGSSETNRRIVLMTLTAEGTRVLSRADALVAAAEERFFAVLGPQDRARFDAAVQRLRRAAEQHDH